MIIAMILYLGGTCQHAFTRLVYFVSEGKSGGRIEARETHLMNVKTAFFCGKERDNESLLNH